MKVILSENVKGLGCVGDIVEVKAGYARNFLIPRNLVTTATPKNVKVVEQAKAKEIKKEKELKGKAEEMIARIAGTTCVLEANVGEDEKLYGSVTNADIQEALAGQGLEIDRNDILLKAPIRKTGSYQVEVRCHTTLKAVLKFSVVQKKV